MIPVTIVQVFRTERRITINVDTFDAVSAREAVLSGEVDTPSFGDPAWRTSWSLENEDVEI